MTCEVLTVGGSRVIFPQERLLSFCIVLDVTLCCISG
uniref:Uncharacterized protein n=1 Tax=Anguilla anguilla TaxID=7936 RepID=A0A0E9S7Z7_ANGAN